MITTNSFEISASYATQIAKLSVSHENFRNINCQVRFRCAVRLCTGMELEHEKRRQTYSYDKEDHQGESH